MWYCLVPFSLVAGAVAEEAEAVFAASDDMKSRMIWRVSSRSSSAEEAAAASGVRGLLWAEAADAAAEGEATEATNPDADGARKRRAVAAESESLIFPNIY